MVALEMPSLPRTGYEMRAKHGGKRATNRQPHPQSAAESKTQTQTQTRILGTAGRLRLRFSSREPSTRGGHGG